MGALHWRSTVMCLLSYTEIEQQREKKKKQKTEINKHTNNKKIR